MIIFLYKMSGFIFVPIIRVRNVGFLAIVRSVVCTTRGAWRSGSRIWPVLGWFESLSTHHCWSFIPSLVVWSMTKNSAFGGEKQNKKSNGEQSDLCDLEQVTLKPQLQVHHCLTIGLQIWYHSLL